LEAANRRLRSLEPRFVPQQQILPGDQSRLIKEAH